MENLDLFLLDHDKGVCSGCDELVLADTGNYCPRYANPGKTTMIHSSGECAVNQKAKTMSAVRVRQGQKKTKRMKG